MDILAPSTRRDQRFRLEPGGSVEFSAQGRLTAGADLVAVSFAGLAFRCEAEPEAFSPGTALEDLKVHLGQCIIEGAAVVRNVLREPTGRIEVGCLFYPSCGDEDRWMTLITGIGAATVSERDDR